MADDLDNDFDYAHKLRLQTTQDSEKFRSRASKASRSNQRAAKSGRPGGLRLRRNKHWSW